MTTAKPTTPLVRGIERLRCDQRFASLFQARPMALALWILEVDVLGTSSARLLYAWVISSPPAARGWTSATGKDFGTGVQGTRYRFRRLVLADDPDCILSIMTGLLNGSTLAEAAAAARVPVPEHAGALRLGEDRHTIESSFVHGPVRLLISEKHSGRDALRQMSSPSHTQPAFCASLVRLDKKRLLVNDDGTPLPGADELARRTLLYLKDETGLDFTRGDAARLGNVEWLALPTTDAFENDYVSAETRRVTDGDDIRVTHVDVRVRPGPLAEGTRLLVRCRLFVGSDIATDECREGTVGGPTVEFPVHDDISRFLVTIWTFENGRVARVWFEHEAFLIRELVFHMGVLGLSGRLDSDWTQGLAKKRKPLAERVDKVRALQQVSYELSTGAGRRAPWELAERQIDRLARRLFPQSSTARFFQRGWADEGRVGFVEWFIALTSDPAATDVLIVDPYFDADGVVDFLARVRATQIRYAVLTNSQVASKDDPGDISGLPPAVQKSARAERLLNACKHMRDILSRVRFEIRDVRSKGASTDSLFHDRYILVFGTEGGEREVTHGFHLSNSIQGATRASPLLVTPIPEDILDAVAAYVDSLVQADPAVVGVAETVIVASTETLQHAGQLSREQPLDLGNFFADLLDTPALRSLHPADLRTELSSRGLVINGGSFRFTPALQTHFRAFLLRLLQRDKSEFTNGWRLVGEWLAHLAEGNDAARSIIRECGSPLAARLFELLEASPANDPPLGFRGLPLGQAISGRGHLFRRSFDSALEEARYTLDFRDRAYAFHAYGIRYAIRALVDIAPEQLIVLAERAWDAIPIPDRENDATPTMRATLNLLAMIMDRLLDAVRDDRVRSAMIASRMPIFRAIAAQYSVPSPERPDVASSLDWLRRLAPDEELATLSDWVSELRVEANRNDFIEPAAIRALRLRAFAEIEHVWPEAIADATLRRLSRRIGGPGEGGWAVSTTEELFTRLIATGKLTWERVARLWFGILSERLNAMLSGRSESRYSFYGPNDIPLSEAASLALSRCAQDTREQHREALLALQSAAMRTLAAPFARSRDYARWADAANGLCWVQALAGCVLLQARAVLSEDERHSWNALRDQIRETLSKVTVPEEGGIPAFEAQVAQALRQQ